MARQDPRRTKSPDTVNEIIEDATIRHMLFLEGVKTRQARETIAFIDTEIIPDLEAELQRRLSRDLSTMGNQRIELMISQFKGITDRFKNLPQRLQGDLFDIAQNEQAFTQELIERAFPVNVDFNIVSPALLNQAVTGQPFDGKNLQQWFDSLAESTQQRLASEIRRGIVQGETSAQIVSRIRNGNVISTTRAQTNAVVRTATQHAAVSARQLAVVNNPDIFKEVKWVATLDSRTCPTCMALDGETFPIDEGVRPPRHVSCRCLMTAIAKSFREMGIDADELPEGTRVSMTGKVPESQTYGEWLKRQSQAVQEQALGKKRAKLFRKGNLSVNQFVNRRGEDLTLDELRLMDAQAFKDAGL